MLTAAAADSAGCCRGNAATMNDSSVAPSNNNNYNDNNDDNGVTDLSLSSSAASHADRSKPRKGLSYHLLRRVFKIINDAV